MSLPHAIIAVSCALCHFAATLFAGDPTTWASQYKIAPWETSRLTAADVVGPDGIVYPDFRFAGCSGGVPEIDPLSPPAGWTVYNVTAAPYNANGSDTALDDTAVSSALTAALSNAGSGGKSIVYFPAGTYHLSQQRTINRNNVVIAGAGMTATTLKISGTASGHLFLFTGEQGGVDYVPWGGNYLHATADIARGGFTATFDADPATQGYAVGTWTRIGATLPTLTNKVETTMKVRYSKPDSFMNYYSVSAHLQRNHYAKIVAIDSATKTVTFDRCFPHDYYADEVPQMRRGGMIEGCGLQDLKIETTAASVGLNPLKFNHVAESWVKNVHVFKARNWPFEMESLVRSTFIGCHFDGTWANIGSGSTAYLQPGNMDCLMDSCQANDLRHMPIFQGAMRCVVRGSSFTGETVQSPQCHGRLPVENLVETSVFEYATPRGKSFWATDFTNTLRHGPNGPRQVFYNNRIGSGAAYVQFGGAMENPIIVYNRVLKNDDIERLPSFWATDRTFDAIVRGNSIQTIDTSPFAVLEDPTCTGWDITDNFIYGGNKVLTVGDSQPRLAANNRFLPAGDTPMTPAPEAASIYAWQRAHGDSPRLLIVIERKAISENGATTTARIVRVKTPTTAPLTVSLAADQAGVTLPADVVIPAGSAHADVTLTGTAVSGGEQTVTLTASAAGLLADTEKVFVIDADSAQQPDFGSVTLDTRPAGLPADWHAATHGYAYTIGSQSYLPASNTWTITGAGVREDSSHGSLARAGRHFVYKSLAGDGEIIARLTSTTGESRVGLMIADDSAPICDFVWVEATGGVVSSGNDTEFHGKAIGANTPGAKTVPVWLRLKRTGSIFTAYKATTTGQPAAGDWVQVASVNVYNASAPTGGDDEYLSRATIDSVMHFGMFINSGSATATATATFTDVTHIGTLAGSEPDTTAPAWVEGFPLASGLNSSSLSLSAQTDEAATAFYVVVPDGDSAPSSSQVKAGQTSSGGTPLASGSVAIAAGSPGTSTVSGLAANTAFDVYFVAEDGSANLQGTVTKVDVSTTAPASTVQTITFGVLPGKTFGDAPITLSATASSGLPVSFSVVSGPATLSGSTITITGAGTVTVQADQSGDATYLAASAVQQSFTVAKAALTVTADNKTRAVGASNPAWTVSYSGFVNGDTAASLGGTLAFGGNATTTTTSSPEGTYTITPSGLTSANYDITFASGTLTITAAPSPLLARWEMEEGTGTTSADSSGNSRPLTLGGGVTWSTNAAVGSRSLEFSGYNATTNNATFSAPAQANNLLTVEGWVFIDSANLPANTYPRLIETPGFMVSVNNATVNPRRVEFNAKWGTAGKWTTPNNSFPVGEWVHVAVTYDASSTANDPVIYINGTAQTLVESPAPSGTAPTWTGTGVLGNNSTGNRGLTGRLDGWSIRQSLLSASEVNSIMNSPPTITTISAQTIQANGATSALAFAIGDAQTAAASLTLSATSSNTTVVPNANLNLGGSGADRTITVVPAANQTGQTTITLTVSDGTLTANSTFTVTVTETPASWISGYPAVGSLTGATDDPDADGHKNLIEYALGTDPSDSTDRSDPEVGLSGDLLTLTFTPQRVAGLRYVIEASPDLSDWTNQTDITSQLAPGTPHTHSDAAPAGERRFMRLRINEP